MSDEDIAEFFSALGHPIRIKILRILSKGDKFVSELAKEMGISRPLLYLHLNKLEKAGLVETYVEHFQEPPYVKKFVRIKKVLIKFNLPNLELELKSLKESEKNE